MAANLKPPLLLLLCACACASTPPEQAEAFEPRATPVSPARSQGPAGASPAQAEDEFADLEASLEAYEQQLSSNEARLQAMGVLVAVRENVARDAAVTPEAEKPGTTTSSRFAPPPPARPAEPRAPLADGDEDQAARAKTKKAGRPSSQPSQTAPNASPPSAGGGAGRSVSGTTSASSPRKTAEQGWPDASRADAKTEAKDDRGRCAEICDLADSTCDLEGKICDLAARHPGDARYAAVCQRAAEDCRIAAEACTQCSP